ncbi:MAG: phosphatidate cytidylyltransferase [Acidobacteriota bacterium]
MKEFITRTTTAFFLIIFTLAAIIYLPDIYFSALIFVVIGLGVWEFLKLTAPSVRSNLLIFFNGLVIGSFFTFGKPDLLFILFFILFSFGIFFLVSINNEEKLKTFVKDFGIHFIAVFYLFFPLYFLFELKTIGPNFLIFLIFVIAVGDSGAYFIGRAIGKHKIYPVASPKKSLEGIIAGIITAGLAGWASIVIFPVNIEVWVAIATGAVIGFVSQVSDPIESLFKRSAGKKDSGSLLPGHGGVLDRVDSYIFCAPLLYFIISYLWKNI